MKLLWRRAGRLITEAMRGQTARLNAVAAEADFGNTDSQSCTALAGCERRRIFGFCSAANQSARHRPFFRFFSRAAATSGPCFPQGAAQAASWFFISAPPHGLWHLPMPQRAKPAQLLQAQHHGRSLRNPYGADKKSGRSRCCPPCGDDGMKNIAAARIQCETGQEEKDA